MMKILTIGQIGDGVDDFGNVWSEDEVLKYNVNILQC